MNSPFNISPEQQELLLNLASKRLGTDPAKLRAQMEGGQAESLLSGLPQEKQAQVANLLQNPAALEQLIQNPNVQKLLSGLMGK